MPAIRSCTPPAPPAPSRHLLHAHFHVHTITGPALPKLHHLLHLLRRHSITTSASTSAHPHSISWPQGPASRQMISSPPSPSTLPPSPSALPHTQNFHTLKTSWPRTGAGLAADDLILTLYFATLYTLAKAVPPDDALPAQQSQAKSSSQGPGDVPSSSRPLIPQDAQLPRAHLETTTASGTGTQAEAPPSPAHSDASHASAAPSSNTGDASATPSPTTPPEVPAGGQGGHGSKKGQGIQVKSICTLAVL